MQGASLGGPNRRVKGWVGNDIKSAVPKGCQGGRGGEDIEYAKFRLKYIFTLYLSIS